MLSAYSSSEAETRRAERDIMNMARRSISTPRAIIMLPGVSRFDVAQALADLGFDKMVVRWFEGFIEESVDQDRICAFSNPEAGSFEEQALSERRANTPCFSDRHIVALAHVCELVKRQARGEEGFLLVTGGLNIFDVPNNHPSEPPEEVINSTDSSAMHRFRLGNQSQPFSVRFVNGRWEAGVGIGYVLCLNNGPHRKEGQRIRC